MTPAKKTPTEGIKEPTVKTLADAIAVAEGEEASPEQVVPAEKEDEIKELHVIAPDDVALEEDDVVLVNGIRCRISRLRFREHLALGRILTRTAQFIDWTAYDFSAENSDNLISLVISLASNVPMAENELVGLFRKIVYPVENLSKEQLTVFYEYTNNPDLMEVIAVVRVVIKQETENWKSIAKNVETMLPLEMMKAARAAAKKVSGAAGQESSQ